MGKPIKELQKVELQQIQTEKKPSAEKKKDLLKMVQCLAEEHSTVLYQLV
jgi:hypothetical protein